LFNHHFIDKNKERRIRPTAGFSWAQVNPHNDLGRVGGPAAVGGRVGKTKVSVKGLGSSSSCCKQTKLTFASANC
jgi:hypothetical protein